MKEPLTKNQKLARNSLLSKIETGEYALRANPCICGKMMDILIANRDRYNISIRTVLCQACGLVRSDPYYNTVTLSHFYNDEYRKLYAIKAGSVEDFFIEQTGFGKHIYDFLAEKIFKREIKGKNVLEIGCGAGGILETFKKMGNEVAGCDYGESYIQFGKSKGLNLFAGGSDTLLNTGLADIIILNHTFEHMTQPTKELEQIKKLLAPNGILYISLPGIYSIHDTYAGKLINGYLQNAHVWYFTLKTLTSLLSKCGFQLIAGNEIIMAVYKIGLTSQKMEVESPEKILYYLKKTKKLRWYYGLKKFSLRHSAFETLRRFGPLYKMTRTIYRKAKKIQ
ncbi:MAG: class I SAM-dependent methyltransferase [Patescibacteria group bacterium]